MNTCKENNPKNLDEAIANAANACKVICALNTRFAQHGIPMLVMSNAHKLLGEKGNQFLFLDSNDLAFLDTISMREAVQIAELAVKIRKRGNYPYPPINVILSGDTHRGVYWTNLLNELLGLKLKSLPFSNLYRGKHYEGKGLFIITSDLPVAELKRGFPKLYTDVIEPKSVDNAAELHPYYIRGIRSPETVKALKVIACGEGFISKPISVVEAHTIAESQAGEELFMAGILED